MMDDRLSPPPVNHSSQNDDEPSSKIDKPEAGEEDQFFDAGENVAQNSSDVTSADVNFIAENEDLPTDGSDCSTQNSPTSASRKKRLAEPILSNLDDVNTEGSIDGNNCPRADEVLVNGDNKKPEGSEPVSSSENGRDEEAVSQAQNGDDLHQYSTDEFSQDEVKKSRDDAENVNNSSKSTMEVMEDESDSSLSKRNSSEKVVPNYESPDNEADVEATTENSTETNSEIISKNNAPLDSTTAEKDEKVPETSEILAMDDSDVDESLQKNLDAAIKVVEESQSSPIQTSTAEEPETCAKIDDCTNHDDSTKDTISKSENMLEEFQEDAAKINGDSSELLDSRLCPCQVVLFRIDIDAYSLKYVKNKSKTTQLSSDHNADSNLDTSFSKATDGDSNSESLFSETPTNSSPPLRRVLTKAARKMIPSPDRIRKTPRRLARNPRPPPVSESTRPRRKVRDTPAPESKYVPSNSSNSDDEAPLTSIVGKRKAVTTGTRRPTQTVQTTSTPLRISSRRNVPAEVQNFEEKLSVDLSGEKILKCVTIPIISDLIESLEGKSCSELISMIEQRECKSPSQIEKKRTFERGSQRRKLSPTDVEDEDNKTRGKMLRYDEGTSRGDNNFSSRSEVKSTSNKRSSRSCAQVRNYVENSRSDQEVPVKKAKTRTRRNLNSQKKNYGSSDDEAIMDLLRPKRTSRRFLSRRGKVHEHFEDYESDVETSLEKETTSRENSTHVKHNEKIDSDSHAEKSRYSPKAKSTSNKRSPRQSAKVLKYVEDIESDDTITPKKESLRKKKLTHDTDSDNNKSENLPNAKSTSNQRSSRQSAKVLKFVEDIESDDTTTPKKESLSKKKLTHDSDSDDDKSEDLPKAKSTSNQRSSRQSAKVPQYVEDSESDAESALKRERTTRKTSTQDADSNDEKSKDLPKAKLTLSKRTSRQCAKVQKYVGDSESDAESPLKNKKAIRKNSTLDSDSNDEKAEDSKVKLVTETKSPEKTVDDSKSDNESASNEGRTSRKNSTHDTDNDDETTEDLPKAKPLSNKRSSRKKPQVQNYVDDSKSDDESPSKEESESRRNLARDSDDEEIEDLPKAKPSSNEQSSRESVKVQKYTETSESDDETPLKEMRTMRRNSKLHTDSNDEKTENSPNVESMSSKRSSRKRTKVQNYVDSTSDDEFSSKEVRTKRKNSTYNTDSDDEKPEDSSKAKPSSIKRSSRKSVKIQKYTADSESDDNSPSKKEETSIKNSSCTEGNEKNDTDSDEKSAEDSSSETDQSSRRRRDSSSSSET